MVKIAATLFLAVTACLLFSVPTFANLSACDSCACAKTECTKYCDVTRSEIATLTCENAGLKSSGYGCVCKDGSSSFGTSAVDSAVESSSVESSSSSSSSSSTTSTSDGSGSETSGGVGATFKPVMMIGMSLAAFALVF